MTTKVLRAAGYIRVSTDDQVETGSLRAQRREIERHCRQQGHQLVHIYADEGVSAHSDQIAKRPQLARLLADAQAGTFDIVIVHTIDRWARNVRVQGETLSRLGSAGVGFASVTEQFDFTTPAGRLLLTMIGGVSEFFSDQLGVHVTKGQRERAQAGLPIGPVPFGYSMPEAGGVPTPSESDAAAVREVFERRGAGQSNGEIASWLNAEGFRTKTGRIFTAHAIKDLLRCRFFLGMVVYRGEEFPGQHEAILDEVTWERAQRRRQPRRRHRLRPAAQAALRGRVVCAFCGHGLHVETNARGAVLYRERHACECPTNGRAVSARKVDAAVGEYFATLSVPADWRSRISKLATTGSHESCIETLRDQRRRVARAYADGGLTTAEYEVRLSEIDQQIAGVEPIAMLNLDDIAELLADLPALWSAATPAERQALVEPVVDRVTVDLVAKRVIAVTPVSAVVRLCV